MANTSSNPYHLFNKEIWQNWVDQDVTYIKVEELSDSRGIKFFELIPDSELPEAEEMIYSIESEDILDILIPMKDVKFVVHEIYLADLND